MLNNKNVYKYEITYKGPFVITRFWNNGMVTIQYGTTNGSVIIQYGTKKIMYNICQINPYKSNTKIEDINHKKMYDDVNI